MYKTSSSLPVPKDAKHQRATRGCIIEGMHRGTKQILHFIFLPSTLWTRRLSRKLKFVSPHPGYLFLLLDGTSWLQNFLRWAFCPGRHADNRALLRCFECRRTNLLPVSHRTQSWKSFASTTHPLTRPSCPTTRMNICTYLKPNRFFPSPIIHPDGFFIHMPPILLVIKSPQIIEKCLVIPSFRFAAE